MLKSRKENKLIRSKRHIEIVQYDRVLLQHKCHLWLKNYSHTTVPQQLFLDIFDIR